MKSRSIIIAIFFTFFMEIIQYGACAYYEVTTPEELHLALAIVDPGDSIFVSSSERFYDSFKITRSGSESMPIRLMGDGEIILGNWPNSTSSILTVNANHWVISKFTIMADRGHPGILVDNGHSNSFQELTFHSLWFTSISFVSSTQNYLTNCDFRNPAISTYYEIEFKDGSNENYIYDNSINTQYALHITNSSSNNHIDGNRFESFNANSVSLSIGDSGGMSVNTQITNNIFYLWTAAGARNHTPIYVKENSFGTFIYSNEFINQFPEIEAWKHWAVIEGNNTQIVENIAVSYETIMVSPEFGFVIKDGVSGCIFEGNRMTIGNGTTSTICIYQEGNECLNQIPNNNVCTNGQLTNCNSDILPMLN